MLQLRYYQIDIANKAFEILKRTGIVYLVCEVRVGKSVMSLETCRLYGVKKVLFLTKLKAIKGIEKDYKDFGYENSFELVVINNESLHKITDNDFALVISDEHHRNSAFPKPCNSAKTIRERFGHLPQIYLSGTTRSMWMSCLMIFMGSKWIRKSTTSEAPAKNVWRWRQKKQRSCSQF